MTLTIPAAVTRRGSRIVLKSAVADARRHIAHGLTTCGPLKERPLDADSAELWEWVIRNIEPETVPASVMIAAMVPSADEAAVSWLEAVYQDAYIEESWMLVHMLVADDREEVPSPYGINAGRRW